MENDLSTSLSNASLKDIDISLLNVQISIYEDKKYLSLHDSLNTDDFLTTSISPSNECENVISELNARIGELLKENEKWKIVTKKFTISKKNM